MKKTLLYLFLTINFIGISQTLEKSYRTEGESNNHINYSFISENKLYYVTFNTSNRGINIFDRNHSYYKSISPLELPQNFLFDKFYFITDKLFDLNLEFEILLGARNNTTGENKMLLFNEKGNIIFDFGDKNEANVFKDVQDNFKLMTSLSHSPYSGYQVVDYDIYSLDGTLSISQENFLAKQKIIGFPNPTKQKINITNPFKNNENEKIEVYDINGRKVLEKEFVGNGKSIELDISKLSKGIYNYRIREFGNKFIKK
ncbi:T9SS type A sorting domain-containing protein [uncultured Polaribacter sp.]|uniref:T9SS type A sorting domain-containing protein n=1 Tax=uncultured Polaribacter sp. TaxID=174711 RepID=UPI002612EC8F|nr:T9SS type A sorting domain-containing protein [uncultured Polaribacter sp.]